MRYRLVSWRLAQISWRQGVEDRVVVAGPIGVFRLYRILRGMPPGSEVMEDAREAFEALEPSQQDGEA